MPEFDLGHVVITPGVQETLERHRGGNGMEELIHNLWHRPYDRLLKLSIATIGVQSHTHGVFELLVSR